ncbi:hypothetical protein NEUTE1DRAFT_116041, partial [Neurospora tetrasperma FGSC 2508]
MCTGLSISVKCVTIKGVPVSSRATLHYLHDSLSAAAAPAETRASKRSHVSFLAPSF